MPRILVLTSLLLANVGIGNPVLGQSSRERSESLGEPAGPAPTLAFQTGGGYLGNFFQVPNGASQKDVFVGTGRIRLDYPLFGSNGGFNGGLGGDLYDGFDPSFFTFLGSRWNRGIHRLELNTSFRTRSPRSEVGDTIGFADVFIGEASYKVRPMPFLQVEVLAEMDRQAYNFSRERDNHAFKVGGGLRFLGLGYVFSPEFGAATGARDVKANEEDYDERTFWATIRSVPTRLVYLSLRYRNREREYSLDDPDSRNFRREDARRDLTLSAEWRLGEHWSWQAYLSVLKAESTKPSRTFDTEYLWTGLTYSFQ